MMKFPFIPHQKSLRKYLTIEMIRGFPGATSGKKHACQFRRPRDTGSIPGSGRSQEGGMATHSSLLPWRIPCTGEAGRLRVAKSQTRLKWRSTHACRWSEFTAVLLSVGDSLCPLRLAEPPCSQWHATPPLCVIRCRQGLHFPRREVSFTAQMGALS